MNNLFACISQQLCLNTLQEKCGESYRSVLKLKFWLGLCFPLCFFRTGSKINWYLAHNSAESSTQSIFVMLLVATHYCQIESNTLTTGRHIYTLFEFVKVFPAQGRI